MKRPAARPTGSGGPLGIICGGGDFPVQVAEAAQAAGRDVLLIGLQGSADPGIEAFPHVWAHVGEVGKVFKALGEAGAQDLILVGSVRRPAAKDVKLDWVGMKSVASLGRLLSGGDDQVLAGLITFLEEHGYLVLGIPDVAPDLLVRPGPLGRSKPDKAALSDVAVARKVLEVLGPFDVGQAAVVADGRVLAVEAAEGTDSMLRRVAKLRAQKRLRGEGGCLVKMAKSGQDLRVDLPAIGPKTVEGAVEAKLSGIAVEAGRAIATDTAALVKTADKAGLYIYGFGSGGGVP